MGLVDLEWSKRHDATTVWGNFLLAIVILLIVGWKYAAAWVGLSVLFLLGYRWYWGQWPWRLGPSPFERVHRGYGVLMVVLGAAAVIGGLAVVSTSDDDHDLRNRGIAVDGSIQQIRGAGYSYTYSWNGELHRNSASTRGADYLGAPITVLVDPEDPDRSMVQGQPTNDGPGAMYGVLVVTAGVALIAWGAQTTWRSRKAPVR